MRITRLLLLFPLFFVLGFLSLFLWWKGVSAPADPENKTPQDFLIVRGESAQEIGSKLEKEGLVRSGFAFKFYTQVTGKAHEIQAGEYRLSPNLALGQLVLTLTRGPQELWVTYPEGFRREEIATKTIQTLGFEVTEADNFWFEFLASTVGEEGFLFPDTYLFARDVSAKTVAGKLRSTFDARVTDKMVQDAKAAGLSMDEVVTLASIVERETLTRQERPVVAGILIKRWQRDWPLQADATLQYILASQNCATQGQTRGDAWVCYSPDFKWWNIPTADHRKTLKSPYNTYLNPGLPPGPIANPGLESIKAVIYPEDSPYWFYLHDTSGKIHYAETIEEHEENIDKYLR